MLYGTQGLPNDISPSSINFFHSSLTTVGVGVDGAEISPPRSRLRLARGRCVSERPSNRSVLTPDCIANSFAI